MFILIEQGKLYHFTSEDDARSRSEGWLKKYGTPEILLQQKAQHDAILKTYRAFLQKIPLNTWQALDQLQTYFINLLPLILVAIELPEYLHPSHDPRLLESCLRIRQENEDVYKLGLSTQSSLLRHLEDEQGIALGTLSLLTQLELEHYRVTGFLPADLGQRRDFVLVRQTKEESALFFSRADLERFSLIEPDPSTHTGTLQGKTAFPGVVRGSVRIIHTVEEAGVLEEGEILVTAMTDPRYLPAIRRAAAIVTNEGGITCHAAIVSRELQKPCVIGIKFATQTLKTGEVVEVNATLGTVRHI